MVKLLSSGMYKAFLYIPIFQNGTFFDNTDFYYITGEIAVYAYLMYCEDRKTFQCHPSYKTIGNAVGMSKNTVKKYVDSLIEKQLITAEPTSVITQKGEKRNGNLRYTIRPIAEAVERYYEQQLIRLHEETRHQAVLKKLAEFDRKYGGSAV